MNSRPKNPKYARNKNVMVVGGSGSGKTRFYVKPTIDYDKVMRLVPCGKLITVGTIREFFAKQSGADFTEPITAGIFVSIVAWASYQRAEDKIPY